MRESRPNTMSSMLYLLIAATVLGLAIGALRGGSIERLATLRIRWPWLALLALAVQVVLFASPLADALDPWAAAIHLGSVALIGVVILTNRHLPGLALCGVGLALNALVFAFNGGFMPVSAQALIAVGGEARVERLSEGERTQKTFLMRGTSTPLWFLADVLPVPPLGKVYSPGDVMAAVGVLVLVARGMGRREPAGQRRRVDASSSP